MKRSAYFHLVSVPQLLLWLGLSLSAAAALAQPPRPSPTSATPGADEASAEIIVRPDLFQPLTEPPCSYCSTQNRKKLIESNDRVISWIRGAHNGGAIPLRHFLAGPRVINDTYGLFFFDADGGYVAAYEKDYGYKFYGWRRGVMIVQGPDGTLWSALTGRAIEGPRQGDRLRRIPSLLTTWDHWLMLHPESTAYDLFDGQRYPVRPLPEELSREARQSMGDVDERLPPLTNVMGVERQGESRAYPLSARVERACYRDTLAGRSLAVFWYGPTSTGVVFEATLEGRELTFYADEVSPESAPFKDRETGTRWTLAGRGVDGPLRGKELTWVPSVQARWYAWVAEHPETDVYAQPDRD